MYLKRIELENEIAKIENVQPFPPPPPPPSLHSIHPVTMNSKIRNHCY